MLLSEVNGVARQRVERQRYHADVYKHDGVAAEYTRDLVAVQLFVRDIQQEARQEEPYAGAETVSDVRPDVAAVVGVEEKRADNGAVEYRKVDVLVYFPEYFWEKPATAPEAPEYTAR